MSLRRWLGFQESWMEENLQKGSLLIPTAAPCEVLTLDCSISGGTGIYSVQDILTGCLESRTGLVQIPQINK